MRAPAFLAALCLAVAAPRAGAAEGELPPLPQAGSETWRAVGRVNVAGFNHRTICSGTLVAPDRVVTAAHCVSGADGRPVPLHDLHFVAGWHLGTHAGHAQAAAVHLHPRWRGLGQSHVASDVAVIRLEAALAVPPLPAAASAGGRGLRAVLGYQFGRPNALSGRTDCAVVKVRRGHMQLACAAAAGSSGGPVLERRGDGWRVVGVVSGGTPPGAAPRIHAALLDRWALERIAPPR